MTQAANGYRTAVTRTLRPIVMASVLADELSHELYLSMDHSSSSLSAFELAQAWTMLLLIAAVMWQRRRMVMVTGAISLVLALTRGTANGLEIVLIPAASLVAQLTMSWRGRALVHAALQLVTLGCVVHASGGRNLEMWVVFTLIQLGSTLLAWTGDWILTRRERLLNEAAAYREESSALRSREMSRLADEMEQTITGGLTRIRAISSSRPTDAELAAALDEVAAENRAVVSDLRTLVHGLRTSAQRESPTAPTGHPCATRWFRSAAVVLLLGVFVTLVAMPASIGQLAVCWPLTVVLVMVLWPRLAPALVLLVGTSTARVVVRDHVAVAELVALFDDCLVAGLVTFGLRELVLGRRRAAESLVEAHRTRMEDAAGDRAAVAREVHDVVGHQLSVTSMQLMEASLSDDPRTRRETLEGIRQVADAAERDLAVLLASLREHDASASPGGPLVRPSTAVDQNVAALLRAGHEVDMETTPGIDHLPDPVQRTITRILQEATTNILRHAEPGSTCRVEVRTDDLGSTQLLVSNQPRVHPLAHPHSHGWGLRGINERMELLGAEFHAGLRHGRWVVDAHFPPPHREGEATAA